MLVNRIRFCFRNCWLTVCSITFSCLSSRIPRFLFISLCFIYFIVVVVRLNRILSSTFCTAFSICLYFTTARALLVARLTIVGATFWTIFIAFFTVLLSGSIVSVIRLRLISVLVSWLTVTVSTTIIAISFINAAALVSIVFIVVISFGFIFRFLICRAICRFIISSIVAIVISIVTTAIAVIIATVTVIAIVVTLFGFFFRFFFLRLRSKNSFYFSE